VSVNDVINAERLPAAVFGDVITLDQVPLVDTSAHSLVGRPLVLGASVTVRVAEQTQDAKRKRLARRASLSVCSTVSAWRTAVNVGATCARQPRGAPLAPLAREHAQVATPGQTAAPWSRRPAPRCASCARRARRRGVGGSVARRISWVNSQKKCATDEPYRPPREVVLLPRQKQPRED